MTGDRNRHRPLLREASRLYKERVKPALKRGLLNVKPDAVFDNDDYVIHVADNLLPGLTVGDIEDEFAAGAGGELKDKMRAPWSSSALAVNAFLPWRVQRTPVLFLGIDPRATTFAFEVKCPNKVSRTPPHLDVLFASESDIVAVESKCTEFVQGATHTRVSPQYLRLVDRGDARASSRWFAALAHADEFALLDSYQLVKHYLGLRNTYPGHQLTLVYLYWEPPNASDFRPFVEHRAEVARFFMLVDGDATCRFVPASYGDVWREWSERSESPEWLPLHLEHLDDRYLGEI